MTAKTLPVAPLRTVSHLLEMLEAAGGNRRAALAAAHVNPETVAAQHGHVTHTQFDRLLIEVRRQTGRSDLAFAMGCAKPLTIYGLLGLAALSASSVEASIMLIARYYGLVTGLYTKEYHRTAAGGVVTFSARVPISPETRQMHVDLIVASFHTQLVQHTGLCVEPYDIAVALPSPTNRWRHRDLQPATVSFDGDMRHLARMELPSGYLNRPLPMANARTCRTAEQLCAAELAELSKQTRLADRVAAAIRSTKDRRPMLETIAAKCNCSSRTLDRRLAMDGTSFRAIVAEVRRDLAEDLLAQDDCSVSEIAYRLGYTDVANFSRSFRKSTGMSPSAFRHQRAQTREK